MVLFCGPQISEVFPGACLRGVKLGTRPRVTLVSDELDAPAEKYGRLGMFALRSELLA